MRLRGDVEREREEGGCRACERERGGRGRGREGGQRARKRAEREERECDVGAIRVIGAIGRVFVRGGCACEEAADVERVRERVREREREEREERGGERIFIRLMTSDRKFKASMEGSR